MMKKLKKMLALIMAVASIMALGMFTTSASAAGTQVADTAKGGAQQSGTSISAIKVYKQVTASASSAKLPTMTFYAKMTPATDSEIQADVTAWTNAGVVNNISTPFAGVGSDQVIQFDFSAADTLNGAGKITKENQFDLTGYNFTKSGVYRYYVTEVVQTTSGSGDTATTSYVTPANSSTGYITYDLKKYTVDICVKPNSDNSALVVTNVAVYDENYATSGEKPEYLQFNNSVSCSTITISKVYGDNTTPKELNEEFTFRVLIPAGGDTIHLDAGETISATLYKLTDDGVTLDSGTPVALTVDDIEMTNDASCMENCSNTFQLAAGEKLEISAPVSMIYMVQETPADEYTTSITYTILGTFQNKDNSQVTGTATLDQNYMKGTTNTNTNNIVFTNSRTVTVPGGVSVDVLPYAVVVAVAAAGCVLFLVKKNRETR